MYPFSRGLGVPLDCALAMAALPLAITWGERCPANGLPQYVRATPQYAMAQVGSCLPMLSKSARASGNQNEWSSATAKLKSSLTAGLQEVLKSTVPALMAPGLAP